MDGRIRAKISESKMGGCLFVKAASNTAEMSIIINVMVISCRGDPK